MRYSSSFAYPLLTCNLSNLNERLVAWADPRRDYAFYSLARDMQEILSVNVNGSVKKNYNSETLFDSVHHWPPEYDSDSYHSCVTHDTITSEK